MTSSTSSYYTTEYESDEERQSVEREPLRELPQVPEPILLVRDIEITHERGHSQSKSNTAIKVPVPHIVESTHKYTIPRVFTKEKKKEYKVSLPVFKEYLVDENVMPANKLEESKKFGEKLQNISIHDLANVTEALETDICYNSVDLRFLRSYVDLPHTDVECINIHDVEHIQAVRQG